MLHELPLDSATADILIVCPPICRRCSLTRSGTEVDRLAHRRASERHSPCGRLCGYLPGTCGAEASASSCFRYRSPIVGHAPRILRSISEWTKATWPGHAEIAVCVDAVELADRNRSALSAMTSLPISLLAMLRGVIRTRAALQSRSRRRADRSRAPHDLELVRRLRHELADASLARQGLPAVTTNSRACPWASHRHPASWRLPSPIRTSRGIVFRCSTSAPAFRT
jgi:hypothetical protein